jgi:hypothetical protein
MRGELAYSSIARCKERTESSQRRSSAGQQTDAISIYQNSDPSGSVHFIGYHVRFASEAEAGQRIATLELALPPAPQRWGRIAYRDKPNFYTTVELTYSLCENSSRGDIESIPLSNLRAFYVASEQRTGESVECRMYGWSRARNSSLQPFASPTPTSTSSILCKRSLGLVWSMSFDWRSEGWQKLRMYSCFCLALRSVRH